MKDLVTHRDYNYKFSFSYPKSWASVTTTYEGTRFKIVSNNGHGNDHFMITVHFFDELKKKPPKEYVDELKTNFNEITQGLKTTLPNLKIIEQNKTFISCQEAYYLIATFTYRSMGIEMPMKMIQVHTAKMGFAYTVTARTTKERFDSMLPTFKIMMMGFVVHPTAEQDDFSLYHYPSDGFEAAFPQKPLEFRTDIGPERGYVNSYQAVVTSLNSQYSVFVSHSTGKVFEEASIDAYLKGIVRGLTKKSDEAVLKYTKRTKLLGFPAIEYHYTHKIEGVPAVGHGIVFIVDGDSIRLSQIYATDTNNAEKDFNKFVDSFRLIPIDGTLSKQRFNDPARNISFSPPEGWQQNTSKSAPIVAIFTNSAGHSITVLDSGTSAYVCDNYKSEMQTTRGVEANGEISAHSRTLTWVKFTGHNATAGIRMTSVHYCVNTMSGAVIMIGAAPEQTFFRSETIFLKTASSMVVRK